MQLVTHQTGPEGQEVRKVLVEETADIAQELYVSITLDRAQGKPVIMASAAGGWTSRRWRRRSREPGLLDPRDSQFPANLAGKMVVDL